MWYEDAETEIASELDIYNLTKEDMYNVLSEKQIELLSGRVITIRNINLDNDES